VQIALGHTVTDLAQTANTVAHEVQNHQAHLEGLESAVRLDHAQIQSLQIDVNGSPADRGPRVSTPRPTEP
jgi:hypothetical protein